MWRRYFSNIYVLALPERRSYIEGVMAALGVPDPMYVHSSFRADYPVSSASHAPYHDPFVMGMGDYRTWAGHVTAMNDFLASNGSRMLIFEDDIEAADAFTPDRLSLMQHVPTSGIVYLGRCWSHCWLDTPVVPGIVRTRKSSCMHAVSLSRSAARKFVTMPPYAAADDILQDIVALDLIPAYAFQPGLFFQNQTRFHTTSAEPRPDRITRDCKLNYIPLLLYIVVAVLCTAIAYMLRLILSVK